MQPSEIEQMPYYEYEITLENLHELLKEKQDAEKRAHGDQQKNSPNYGGMMKNYSNAYKVPKFKTPKI